MWFFFSPIKLILHIYSGTSRYEINPLYSSSRVWLCLIVIWLTVFNHVWFLFFINWSFFVFSHKYFKQAAQTELLSDNLTFTGHELELPGAENARHHVFRFFVVFFSVLLLSLPSQSTAVSGFISVQCHCISCCCSCCCSRCCCSNDEPVWSQTPTALCLLY